MDEIILATSSPYRIERFKKLGINFITEGSNVDEYFDGRPNAPEELVQHLARLKAQSVAKNHSQGIIIGFDSIAYFEGNIIEKPMSRQEEDNLLKSLSGKTHEFYTGIYMINLANNKILTSVGKTSLLMSELEEGEINRYLDQDPNYPKGFNYGIFIKSIQGSYNSFLCGLPTEKIIEMLKQIGYVF